MKNQALFLFALVAIAITSCTKDSDVKPEPIPYFEISSTELFLGQEVSFTNNSENATAYRWDFGDGTISKEKDPVHKYNEPGEYNVSLQVGPSNILTKTLTVHDADRAVFLSNEIESDLDITLFDRISANEIGKKRYKLGIVESASYSDTLYIKDEALGIAGIQDEALPFVILDPLTFELEKGKINKLIINQDTRVVYGLGLPEWK